MNGVITTVELLQLLLMVILALVGMGLFKLSFRQIILPVIVILPAPILMLTPGVAGFVYAADVYALMMILHMLSRANKIIVAKPVLSKFIVLAAALVLFLPAVSTTMASVGSDKTNIQEVALGIIRGIEYFAIFVSGIWLAANGKVDRRFLYLQVLGFFLICISGVAQAYSGINLDLWNNVRALEPGKYANGYGGGFMGLYRGAVGAWASFVLALLPVIIYVSKKFWVSTILVFLVIVIAVLSVGSRQGLYIGLMGFIITSLLLILSLKESNRFAARTGGFALIVSGLLFVIWSVVSNTSFGYFVQNRISDTQGYSGLFEATLNRDPRMADILEKMAELPQEIWFGVGYGHLNDTLVEDYRMLYVDSELLWTIQQGGVITLVLYFAFAFLVIKFLLSKKIYRNDDSSVLSLVGASTMIVGSMLMYGHFFLLNVNSFNAPVAFWSWLILGMSLGARSYGTVPKSEKFAELVRS